jgi:hypothetical protein
MRREHTENSEQSSFQTTKKETSLTPYLFTHLLIHLYYPVNRLWHWGYYGNYVLHASESYYGVVSWLRRLIASLSQQSFRLGPKLVHVSFAVDKEELGHCSASRLLRFSSDQFTNSYIRILLKLHNVSD